MVTRPERLVLKFADELNGTPAAAGWTLLTRKDNGKDEASELAVIDMELVPELAQQFNLGVVTANQKLTTDLAAKTAQYDSEVAKVTALTAEKATLTTEKTTLTEQLATANATIEQLQARITALEAIRQFNPRWTTPDFFQNRFTVKTARMFERSDDPVIAGGRDLLDEYELRGYHVDLDDAQVQGLTAYMVQLGMLTEQERTHVLRDATAAEAWYPQ